MFELADLTSFGAAVLVPIVGTFFVFGFPVLAFVFFRLLKHRERMEMIRNGITPNDANFGEKRGRGKSPTLERQTDPSGMHSVDAANAMLRKGITLSFIGFALTIGLSCIGYHTEQSVVPGLLPQTTWEPGPWLLGGLIPLFVGLAQVVIALLSGATLRPAVPPKFEPYVVEDAPQTARDTGTFDGSYTYRPGNTTGLTPPRKPPERK